MLLSSGVIWRYRDFEEFRRQCPGGDEALQRLVWERLDEALEWLERVGELVPYRRRTRSRPGGGSTRRALTAALVRRPGRRARARSVEPSRAAGRRDRRLPGAPRARARAARPLEPVVGGRRHRARAASAARTRPPSDEFYGRAMPGPVPEEEFVRASQLYGRFARRVNDLGEEFFPGEVSWSENDLAQAIADQPGGRAWYELDAEALARPEVAERLPYAQETEPLPGGGLRVRVYAAVTHTYGGVQGRHARPGGRRRLGGRRRRGRHLERRLRERPRAGARARAGRGRGRGSVAVELDEALVADPEVVRDLVQRRRAAPGSRSRSDRRRVSRSSGPLVDRDLVRRHAGVAARPPRSAARPGRGRAAAVPGGGSSSTTTATFDMNSRRSSGSEAIASSTRPRSPPRKSHRDG